MNPWPFVVAAYTLAVVTTALLGLLSFRAMRAAERRADQTRRTRP